MTRHAPLVLLTTLALAACGKKSGGGGGTSLEGPPGLEAASVSTVAGTTDLPKVLADVAKARADVLAAAERRYPGQVETSDDDVMALLGSAAGWEAAGLDPKGEVVFATDKRVAMKDDDDDPPVPMPIVILKVDDRGKLLATLAKLDAKLTIGPKEGAVEPLMRGDKAVGYVGAMGDRTAIVMAAYGDPKDVRAGFEVFLAGSGAALADADMFKHAMDHGPSGAGLYYWLGDVGQLEWLGRLMDLRRREREQMTQLMGMQLSAVGARLGQDGLSLRVVPKDSMKDAFKAVYQGNESPKDIGRVIPAKGWLAARLSLDLEGGVAAALSAMGQSDAMLQATLGRMGLSWDEIRGALTGEIGFGLDLANAITNISGSRGDMLPNAINVLGVKDGDKADALVDKLAKLAVDMADLKRRDITVAGKKAIVLEADERSIVIARHDDLLLATQGEAAMAAAIERADGDNLSKTSAGEALRERLVLAAVVDMAPLQAWLDGNAERLGKRIDILPILAAMIPESFKKDPIITVRVGFDGNAQFTRVTDAGLLYGLGLSGIVTTLVGQGARRLEDPPMPLAVEGLPAVCQAYLADVSRCLDEAPANIADAGKKGLDEVISQWRSAPPAGLEASCREAHAQAGSTMTAICPNLKWSAPPAEPGGLEAPTPTPVEVKPDDAGNTNAGDLPASCTKYLTSFERCIEAMPADAQGPAKSGLDQMRSAWKSAPRDGMESACQQALDAMKSAGASMCPGVTWD